MRLDPKSRALEICLQRLLAGEGLAQVLDRYPQWADDLRPLLETALAARMLGVDIQIPETAQAASRERFLEAAWGMRPTLRSQARPAWRWSMAVLALIVLLVAGAARGVVVSAKALPGEPLYPVKIAAERARLWLANGLAQRMALEQTYDEERAREVKTLAEQRRTQAAPLDLPVQFAGPLISMQPGLWQVGEVQVQVPPDTQVIGQVQLGIYVEVTGKLQPDGKVMAQRLQAREFELEGKLLNITGSTWLVDGVSVHLSPDTLIQGSPEVGSQVRVTAYRTGPNDLLGRLVELLSQPSSTGPTPTTRPSPKPSPTAIDQNSPAPIPDLGTEPGDRDQPASADETEAPAPTAEPKISPPQGGEQEEAPQPTEARPGDHSPEPSESVKPEETHQPEETRVSGENDHPAETPQPSETPKPGDNHEEQETSHPEDTPQPTEAHTG